MTKGGHVVYRNMLQVEDTVEIGWLLYSTREMDAGTLNDELEEMLKIKIGFRWKVIGNGVRSLNKAKRSMH